MIKQLQNLGTKWRNEGFDYDDTLARYTLMKALGIPAYVPVPFTNRELAEMSPIDDFEPVYRHIEYDSAHNWPLHGGTTLYADEYNEIEAFLQQAVYASSCYCGTKPIPVGTGVTGEGMPVGPDERCIFCSIECHNKCRARQEEDTRIFNEKMGIKEAPPPPPLDRFEQ